MSEHLSIDQQNREMPQEPVSNPWLEYRENQVAGPNPVNMDIINSASQEAMGSNAPPVDPAVDRMDHLFGPEFATTGTPP